MKANFKEGMSFILDIEYSEDIPSNITIKEQEAIKQAIRDYLVDHITDIKPPVMKYLDRFTISY